MNDEIFKALFSAPSAAFEPVSALYFDVLVKTGQVDRIPAELMQREPESLTGPRIETKRPVPFLVETIARMDQIFTGAIGEEWPMTAPTFLAGCRITLPGIAENAEVTNGQIVLLPFGAVEYSFEFTGENGVQYVCRGQQELSIFHPVTAWSGLPVGVFEKDSGTEVFDWITFIGDEGLPDTVLPFLRNLRIG